MLCAVYRSAKRSEIARATAFAVLAGDWDVGGATWRAGEALRPRPLWVAGVVREVFAAYHRPPADRPRELAAFIAAMLERRTTSQPPPDVRRWFVPESAMGRRRWPVPELAELDALGVFLELEPGDLAWLADTRGLERTAGDQRLRNYRYLARPRVGGAPRLIEAPKPRLKAVQRRLLHDLLDWIPAHPAAHGFTRGRSVITHARAHASRDVVMRVDLEDFFASVPAARIYGVLRTAGYPEAVAHVITGLTTNVVPSAVWAAIATPRANSHRRLGRRLASPHLPQGAPTSPALANLAAFGLDRRLAGLAGAVGLTYTRYADDLTFSGPASLARQSGRLHRAIRAIVEDEGFLVNERKSTLATRAGRQTVCGLVVNERPNVARVEYDTLKAILRNAGEGDPDAQNHARVPDFRAHLTGRIAWVETVNPNHGAKLRERYSRIAWPP
jgi:RNA-directed DNA polymerase